MNRNDLRKKAKSDKGKREDQKRRTQILKEKRKDKNDKTKSFFSDERL